LTTPINNANFSTPPVAQERKADAQANAEQHATVAAGQRSDRADLGRAQQLLSRQTERNEADTASAAIDSMAEARARVAALKQAIQEKPQAALAAQGLIDSNIFEAASARPTA